MSNLASMKSLSIFAILAMASYVSSSFAGYIKFVNATKYPVTFVSGWSTCVRPQGATTAFGTHTLKPYSNLKLAIEASSSAGCLFRDPGPSGYETEMNFLVYQDRTKKKVGLGWIQYGESLYAKGGTQIGLNNHLNNIVKDEVISIPDGEGTVIGMAPTTESLIN